MLAKNVATDSKFIGFVTKKSNFVNKNTQNGPTY